MIVLDLQRIAKLRAIPKLYAFLRHNGFTHYQAHALANGEIKELRLDHLERLCRNFHCLPHELFNYKPTGRGINPANDVLLPLRKKPLDPKDLNSLMASLPPEELENLNTELQARYRSTRQEEPIAAEPGANHGP